jgi:hypothetical protein
VEDEVKEHLEKAKSADIIDAVVSQTVKKLSFD